MRKIYILIPAILSSLVSHLCLNVKRENVSNPISSFSIEDFTMDERAHLTETSEHGLTYKSYFPRDAYESLLSNNESVKFGFILGNKNYIKNYGDFTLENLFGENAVYDWEVDGGYKTSGKVHLKHVNPKITKDSRRVVLTADFTDFKESEYDKEFYSFSYIETLKNGTYSYTFASCNDNKASLIYISQIVEGNTFYSYDERVRATDILNKYKSSHEDSKYTYNVETYKDNELVKTATLQGELGSIVSYDFGSIEGYTLLNRKSVLKDKVYVNNRTVLKAYYYNNPSYTVSYYAANLNGEYELAGQIDGGKTGFYTLVDLTSEQLKLPTNAVLPIEGFKDYYSLNSAKTVKSGLNDGNLNFNVYYDLSSKVVNGLKVKDNEYIVTSPSRIGGSCNYMFLGTYSDTAVVEVSIPYVFINLPGAATFAGITATPGTILGVGNENRRYDDFVTFDTGVCCYGLRTGINLSNGLKGRGPATDPEWETPLYIDSNDTTKGVRNMIPGVSEPIPDPADKSNHNLTVVLQNNTFHYLIDGTYVCKIESNDTHFVDSSFRSRTGKYMFGLFIGGESAVGDSLTLVRQIYGTEASTYIEANSLIPE